MIYIKKTTTELILPKIVFDEADTIVFTNQLTHSKITIPVVDTTPLEYKYTFDITSSVNRFSVGQYDYKVLGNNIILSSGIAQFGEFSQTPKVYTADINIKTYNG